MGGDSVSARADAGATGVNRACVGDKRRMETEGMGWHAKVLVLRRAATWCLSNGGVAWCIVAVGVVVSGVLCAWEVCVCVCVCAASVVRA